MDPVSLALSSFEKQAKEPSLYGSQMSSLQDFLILLETNHNIWFDESVNIIKSEGSKSSTHYLSDTNRFDVSSKGPSSGISVIPDDSLICLYRLGSE